MQISANGIEFIEREEGCKLQAYLDIKGIPTIAVGHTGPEVHLGMEVTKEQADELLKHDLAKVAACLDDVVEVDLTQNQYDALCSLIFNIGVGAFKNSTLLRKLNAGDLDGASAQFLVWCKAGQNTVQALLHRRQREKALFDREDS